MPVAEWASQKACFLSARKACFLRGYPGAVSAETIPVAVVTGFLGSGKTTLLNHLLHNEVGLRIGVIVNDFGKVNIDAMTVAGQVDSMVSLGNGCLCCAVDSSEIDEMLATLTRNRDQVDLVVIEASGLAEPEAMVKMVAGSELPSIRYGGLVQVVDAAEIADSVQRHPQLARHMAIADLIVLNKVDMVTDLALVNEILARASSAPVVRTSHGRVAAELLFDPPERSLDGPQQLSFDQLVVPAHSEHVHAGYVSVEFESDTPLDPARLMDLLRDPPAGLYRVKGFVHFGLDGFDDRFTLHKVGQHIRFTRSPWRRREKARTSLVAIGTGTDRDDLAERLRGCVGQAADADAIFPILRHTASD